MGDTKQCLRMWPKKNPERGRVSFIIFICFCPSNYGVKIVFLHSSPIHAHVHILPRTRPHPHPSPSFHPSIHSNTQLLCLNKALRKRRGKIHAKAQWSGWALRFGCDKGYFSALPFRMTFLSPVKMQEKNERNKQCTWLKIRDKYFRVNVNWVIISYVAGSVRPRWRLPSIHSCYSSLLTFLQREISLILLFPSLPPSLPAFYHRARRLTRNELLS